MKRSLRSAERLMKTLAAPFNRRQKTWRGSPACAALLLTLSAISPGLFAQGTIRYTFEEVPLGVMPSYISLPIGGSQGYSAAVYDSYYDGATAYEGKKFLAVIAGAILTPPQGELITGFTVHMYIPRSGSPIEGQLFFSVNGVSADTTKLNEWQTISARLDGLAQTLLILGDYRIGETFPARFYVDDIQVTTVPEPQSTLVFMCGGVVLWAFRKK